MSFPSANATLDDAIAEYNRTVGYESDPNGDLARSFLTVCRWLQVNRPSQSTTTMQGSAKFDAIFESIQQQIDAAQRWLGTLTSNETNQANYYRQGGSLGRQFGLSDLRGC